MTRLYRAVIHFFRVRTAGFAPAGGWLVFVLKRAPAGVAGFFLFAYVYGPAYQRYRGTFVAVRAWYRAFGVRRVGSPPGWTPPAVVPPGWDPTPHGRGTRRLRPAWRFRPVGGSPELYDSEGYSLESAFPVPGAEPFQEYNHEYFDAQQDLDTFQDDEPHDEGEFLWGTREPALGLEDSNVYERERFRRLAHREVIDKEEYYLLDEPADAWVTRRTRGGLSRLVTPGDGPAVEDEEESDFGLTEWDTLADWYHYRVSPTRITQLPPVWGSFSYLFFEHRQSWRVDPTDRPVGWYRSGRGLVPWLYRTRRRRWGRVRWRIQRYYRVVHGLRSGPWETRRHRRRRRHPGHWLDRRWRRPGLTPGEVALDFFGGPPGRGGLVRRAARGAARAVRFVRTGLVWRRRRRPPGRPGPHRSDRPHRDPRPNGPVRGGFARPTRAWFGRRRPRVAGWHAPRYAPAYDRNRAATAGLPGHPGGLPPTGAEAVGWLLVGCLLFNAAAAAGFAYVCYFGRVGTDPPHPADLLGFVDDSPWRPDFFRRVVESFPDPTQVRREPTPRERVTTKAYSLWTTPVGADWRDNPGVDPGILLGYVADALRPLLGYDTWWFTVPGEQMMVFNKRIAVDRRGIFLWHTGWRQPSWVHMDDRIGDEWVHDPMFRLYHGQLEPFTYRRELDHRYHRYAAMGPTINDQWVDNEIEDNMDELINQLWHYYRGLGVHKLLGLPEWIPPGGARRFHLDFAGYWGLMMGQAVWPSAAHLDIWSATYDLGLSDAYDRFHRKAVLLSDGHHLVGLPTRWEPHVNAELIRRWNVPPVFPQSQLGWRPYAAVRWVDAAVRSAGVVPVGPALELVRSWLYLGGVAYFLFFRPAYLVGLTRTGAVGSVPVGRTGRLSGRHPAGAAGWRSPRRVTPADRDTPEWGRVTPARVTWRWNRELYWAGFRRGRNTEVFSRVRSRSAGPAGWVVPGRPGSPRREPGGPTRVAGLLYQSARVGCLSRAGTTRAALAVPTRAGPPGWLVRPVLVTPVDEEYRPGERPPLVRRGRPRRDWRVHPDGTRPDRHRRVTQAEPTEVISTRPARFPWSYRGHSLARTVQHAWHLQRYRTVVAGCRPGGVPHRDDTYLAAHVGLAGVDYPGRTAHVDEPPVDNGYDPSGVNGEENDDFTSAGNNSHEDVEEFDDQYDLEEEHDGVRYLSVEPPTGVTPPGWGDTFVRRRLRSYERFGSLPLGAYRPAALGDYFDDHTATGWSAAAADHPVWEGTLLAPYGVARWGRRLHRGVIPPAAGVTPPGRRRRRRRGVRPARADALWPTGWDPLWDELNLTGWFVFELDPVDYQFDDLDVVEFGGPDEAHRPGGPAGYHAATYRPATAAALAGPTWSPPAGWNTWRYVVGEAGPQRDDPEGYFLERLSRTYLDHYDEYYFVSDVEALVDRDYDDLHEGSPFEEDNQEVPRTRPEDYPAWLVAAAVAGASAGDVTQPGRSGRLADHDATVEAAPFAYRPGRAQLRRYYRAHRAASRRVRRADPPRLFGGPTGDALTSLGDELGLIDPADPTADTEVDSFAPAGATGLEGDDWTDESLRLWALTELYWGDFPTGSANTH